MDQPDGKSVQQVGIRLDGRQVDAEQAKCLGDPRDDVLLVVDVLLERELLKVSVCAKQFAGAP